MRPNTFKSEPIHLAVYRIHWKKRCGGSSSIASVYMDSWGDRWLAPCNWVSPAKLADCLSDIKRLELITRA